MNGNQFLRALEAVRVLTAIRRERPELWDAICDFQQEKLSFALKSDCKKGERGGSPEPLSQIAVGR
jgi:hypothetical protein